MQERLLKKIIVGFAGQEAEKLVDLLYKKKNVNEFLIAKKLDMTINQTRNMLYKLADSGLVQFIRKKDKKKGGWYTYFWTLNVKRALVKFREKLEEEKASLGGQLASRQSERYYYSPLADIEYTEEEAILHDYTCPETGEVLELKDNTKEIDKIKNDIKEIENQVSSIDEEVEEIEKKEERVKDRRLREEKKKKEEERKKRRLEREKQKAKEARVKGKSVKKKSAKKKAKKKSAKRKATRSKSVKKKSAKKKAKKKSVKKKTARKSKKNRSFFHRAMKSFSGK